MAEWSALQIGMRRALCSIPDSGQTFLRKIKFCCIALNLNLELNVLFLIKNFFLAATLIQGTGRIAVKSR